MLTLLRYAFCQITNILEMVSLTLLFITIIISGHIAITVIIITTTIFIYATELLLHKGRIEFAEDHNVV